LELKLTSDEVGVNEVRIFLFRHGETDWNRERRFQGHTDIELNDAGQQQAKELSARLQALNLNVLLSSDLKRARKTAEIVNADLKLPLFISAALRECRLGDPEGKLRETIIEEYGPPAWARWLSVAPQDHHYGFPNGETKNDHLVRLLRYIEPFCEAHPHFKNIGVSTHGGSVRRLAHYAANSPTEPIALPNCALYELAYSRDDRSWRYVGELAGPADGGDANVWNKA